ncbi:MAG TPA: MmgE/PrpD family protein [Usitatibacteraceae bacterium]|nr:MmgE/PrpD family protein [Burkholderiales bacterium]HQZ46080.1 MmgE/PrpD family protein [Usitatibacteraceae bacterium]
MDGPGRQGDLAQGLERFARIWEGLQGRVVSRRLEGALGRAIACETTEGEALVLTLSRATVEIAAPRPDSAPHATVRMAREDWARVLTGELHVMAIILAGRARFPKDQRRLLMQFSMLLQTAMLSAGAAAPREVGARAARPPSRAARPAVTRAYAEFACGLRFEDIPPDVVAIAREQLVATIGSCYTGSMMPAAASVRAGLAIMGEGGQATLFGGRGRMPAPAAALYNSAVAQVLDFDDWVIISHSGAAVVPAAFAAGEAAGVSGRDLVAAVVIGNEINGRTSRAIQRGAYVGNSMPNHQVETALVASRLLGLTPVEAQRAVSHSAFLAMESCHTGWMTDSKVLCNGLPALWGITSASLAKAGLLGNLDMIEHPAGLLATVSEVVDEEELLKGLGTEWYTRTLNTKRHPSCAYNLTAIECALALHDRIPGFDPLKVAAIEIEGPGVMLYVAARFQALEPDVYEQIREGAATHVALCFDAGFGALAALAAGEFSYRQYLAEGIQSPVVQRLRSRVSFKTDSAMHAAYYSDYQYGARVRVRMEDGAEFVEERLQLLGARDRPFDHAEKFREGACHFMPDSRVEKALATLRRIDAVEDIRTVMNQFEIDQGAR